MFYKQNSPSTEPKLGELGGKGRIVVFLASWPLHHFVNKFHNNGSLTPHWDFPPELQVLEILLFLTLQNRLKKPDIIQMHILLLSLLYLNFLTLWFLQVEQETMMTRQATRTPTMP